VSPAVDELWLRTAARIEAERGWSLERLGTLGRPRETRRTWLAVGEPGTVVVEASANAAAGKRTSWASEALRLLEARGYPVPELLRSAPLDERWFALVQTRLPGEPLAALDDAAALDATPSSSL